MFRLITSNDAAKLATALGERLSARHDNPLIPARVLVPQAGLKRWLQAHIAEQFGVIANVEFTPPAQFAWELLRAARPDLPPHSPFEVDVLRWHLYALLGESFDGAMLAPLRHYLVADGDPLRRYALSFELARVYERMQGYRRDKLLAWERGDGDDWQAELWRRLLPRVGGVSRAARVDAWLRTYDPEFSSGETTDKPALPGLPRHFACFACANVSPDVLRMLAVASKHCDVDFFLPLPSMEYLGDLPRTRAAVRQRLGEQAGDNPLVLSLGGALSKFVELLFGYEHVQPDVEHDAYDLGIARTSLLGRVRDDILKHAAPRAEDRAAQPDATLQFHACHTPLREVETLHDALLGMFEQYPNLQPRDVVVMLPDVATYRPAIEAVFGGIDRADPRWLPFNLGDTAAATEHPVADLFLKLLDAPNSRWEVDELTDLLAAPGVMRRFDLDPDAAARVARRVREAGVRWGEDEHARADCGDYREFSWAFGCDRLLAGFALGDESANELVSNVAPLAGVEGSAFAQLDAVFALTETWRRLRDASRHPKTARAWQALLNETLDSLYQSDPRDLAESRALEHIRAALAQLAEDCRHADANLELPWTDLRAFLREQLAAPDTQQYLFTGGITFCGLVPLRVVPFRVICLLGMNEAAFPRRESNSLDPLLADRRAGTDMRGDRDVRADDRLLFLQLLAAARDAFYVSWIGRDAHTNKVLPPSAVVSELLDVVRDGYLLPPADADAATHRNALLPRVAPLHPFDASLFDAKETLARSFNRAWSAAAAAPQRTSQALPPFVANPLPAPTPLDALSLDDLKRFFNDPARGFLEGALCLRLPRGAEEDAALEPLQPNDGLLRYQLTSTLLAQHAEDSAHTEGLLRAQGALPPGKLADAALGIAHGRADALHGLIRDFTRGDSPLADITGTIELASGVRITGTVTGFFPAGLVRATAGSLNGTHALRARIDALFASAVCGQHMACRLFWIDQDTPQCCDLVATDPDAARAQLAHLVASMQAGLQRPLPLFPKASWNALRRTRFKSGEADADEFIANLRNAADRAGTDFARATEFDSTAFDVAWRGIDFDRISVVDAHALHATAKELLPEIVSPKAAP